MLDPKNSCSIEFETLTEIQKELHEAEDTVSIFLETDDKVTWYSKKDDVCERHEYGNNVYKYLVNRDYDVLSGCYLKFVLPDIRVKNEYMKNVRVKWKQDIGIRIIEKAQLMIKNTVVSELSQPTLHVIYNIMYPRDKKLLIYRDLNYGDSNDEYSTQMLSDTIVCTQPWFFTFNNNRALKLFMLEDDIQFKYTLNNRIEDLIDIQRHIDGRWTTVNASSYKEYLLCSMREQQFIAPDLVCEYALIPDTDKEQYKTQQGADPSSLHFVEYTCKKTQSVKTANGVFNGTVSVSSPLLSMFLYARNSKDDELATACIESLTLSVNEEIQIAHKTNKELRSYNAYKHYECPERNILTYSFTSSTKENIPVGKVFSVINGGLKYEIKFVDDREITFYDQIGDSVVENIDKYVDVLDLYVCCSVFKILKYDKDTKQYMLI